MPRVVIDPAVPDGKALANEIARLRGLGGGELRAKWHTAFRRRAPPSRKKQAVAPTTSAWSSSLIHDVYRRLCGPALAEKISQRTIRQQSAALRGFRPLYVRFGSSLAIGVMFAARPLFHGVSLEDARR